MMLERARDAGARAPKPGGPMRTDVVAAILIGGASRRMGELKQNLRTRDGRTFLGALRDVLAPLMEDVVLLGTPRTDEELALGLPFLPDARDDAGPLAGLVALLESGRARRYLVISCDAPTIVADDLRPLLDADAPAAIYVDSSTGRALYLPCALSSTLAPVARALLDDDRRALRFLFEATRTEVIPVDAEPARRLRGVNTPEELASLVT